MDSSIILKIATIACCFVYCFADIDPKVIATDDSATPESIVSTFVDIMGLTLDLHNINETKNEETNKYAEALIDPKTFDGKTFSEIIQQLENSKLLDNNEMTKFKDSFKDTSELDPKTLSEIKDFFKDKKVFGDIDTSGITKFLDNTKEEIEKAANKAKKGNGSGRNFYGVISIIIPIILALLVSIQ